MKGIGTCLQSCGSVARLWGMTSSDHEPTLLRGGCLPDFPPSVCRMATLLSLQHTPTLHLLCSVA